MTKTKPDSVLAAPRVTKASLLLDLLCRENGATLAELVDATGWLPHTTRAALTGLRKKGHVLARSTRDNATCYRIEAA
jgi:DNA-binding IclR family transcriptional regulator